ncbi:hypothetical protein BTS2_0695 [Bacillus sp. TS-2]|nr:hypothetical protein BTS2_0695 [Bacillus sp. TS-2]
MGDKEKKDNQWLKKLFQGSASKDKTKKKILPIHYMLLVGCGGLLLMVVSDMFTAEDSGTPPSQSVYNEYEEKTDDEAEETFGSKTIEPNSMEDYEIRYENQVTEALNEIVGVNDASVVINLAETEKNIYEKNVSTKQQFTDETDREGGTRKVEDISKDEQLVLIRNGDVEEPVLIKTEKPSIRGVLVVANGVENALVKSYVVEAVSRVLDVPSHRVSVMPKKSKEE